jgi:hypothetical protein
MIILPRGQNPLSYYTHSIMNPKHNILCQQETTTNKENPKKRVQKHSHFPLLLEKHKSSKT